MRTVMGQGVDFMINNAWHGKAPNKEQLERGLAQLEETWVIMCMTKIINLHNINMHKMNINDIVSTGKQGNARWLW
jgi:hypothetical protein